MHWKDLRTKLSADIEGSMTESLLKCHRILDCQCCEQSDALSAAKNGAAPGEGGKLFAGVENIKATREDMTILMEILMYQGRDVNLVEVFNTFKDVHKLQGFATQEATQVTTFDDDIRYNFGVALANLKYMGFLSATKQSTFLFKKNLFGKPSYFVQASALNE